MKKHMKNLLLGIATIGMVTPSISAIAIENNMEVQNMIQTQTQTYKRQVTTVNDEKMSYIQLGNAKSNKDMVIIHGSAFNATVMLPYAELYAKDGYNVIVIDTLGHYGNISKSKDTLEDLSDSVAGLIKQLKKEKKIGQKVELQGWSLGGSITLDIAARYPEIVKSAGIIDGASNWHGMDLGHYDDEETKNLSVEGFIRALASKNAIPGIVDKLASQVAETSAPYEACNNDFLIDKTLNIDDELKDIKVPVNIFYGTDDTLSTIEIQKDMANSIKKSQITFVEGLGHMAVLDNPQAVYDAFTSMRK